MERRSIIKQIFGKEAGITKEEIDAKILGKLNEGPLIEYKRVDRPKSDVKSLIISEIVAFLNKLDSGGGILVLGISAPNKIPVEVIGVEDEIVADESALRNIIIDGVVSAPHFLEFPDIEIEPISIGTSKKVYLIEVHPKDLNVLYFNRVDGSAYVREIDTTRKLSLEESIKIVDTKKIAKLYVNLEQMELKIDNDFAVYKIKVVFMNKGNKPASNVVGMFLFDNNAPKGSRQDVKVDFFDTNNIKETSNINACSKSFQQNFPELFYPGRPVVVGFFNLRFLRALPSQLYLEIDEQNGRTTQLFSFSEAECKELSRNFNSYA